MKLIRSIILGAAVLTSLSLFSCSEWLDVNTDPENPSSMSASFPTRLAHIESFIPTVPTNLPHGAAACQWETGQGITMAVHTGICLIGIRKRVPSLPLTNGGL